MQVGMQWLRMCTKSAGEHSTIYLELGGQRTIVATLHDLTAVMCLQIHKHANSALAQAYDDQALMSCIINGSHNKRLIGRSLALCAHIGAVVATVV